MHSDNLWGMNISAVFGCKEIQCKKSLKEFIPVKLFYAEVMPNAEVYYVYFM